MYEDGTNKGNQFYHLLLRDGKHIIVGIDVVRISKKSPSVIWQYMAGVIRAYRNKRLTTWMKAHIYQKLTQESSTLTEIRTDCYKNNKAIIHINQKMDLEVCKEITDMYYQL